MVEPWKSQDQYAMRNYSYRSVCGMYHCLLQSLQANENGQRNAVRMGSEFETTFTIIQKGDMSLSDLRSLIRLVIVAITEFGRLPYREGIVGRHGTNEGVTSIDSTRNTRL